MAITSTPAKLHWNYFLALEQDMDSVSRYIEFCEPNFSVYSIELARLLFAAASEVDVIAKLLCELLAPDAPKGNINEYKSVLLPAFPDLPGTEVFVARYGLLFKPWSNWADSQNPKNPSWWRSYNKVKHERAAHFNQATLKNSLNALGALLILIFHYYSRKLATHSDEVLEPKATTSQLVPESSFIHLDDNFYHAHLVF